MIDEPTTTVRCDACGFFDAITLAGYNEKEYTKEDLAAELDAMGWKTIGDNKHHCEDCK